MGEKRKRYVAFTILVASTLMMLNHFGAQVDGADIYDIVRYDETDDKYHLLRVYAHIEASGDFIEFWRLRENMIPVPCLLPAQDQNGLLFAATGRFTSNLWVLRRVEERTIHFASSTLFAREEQVPYQSPFSWASVDVRPGGFFLSPDKTLCMYHQVAVPGSLIDEAFDWMSEELRKLTRSHIDRLTEASISTSPVDELVLELLSQATEEGAFRMTRKKQGQFEFRTSSRLGTTIEARLEALDGEIAAYASRDGLPQEHHVLQQKMQAELRAAMNRENEIVFTYDFASHMGTRQFRTVEHIDSSYRRAMERVRAAGIEIDVDLTLDQLVQLFLAGKLDRVPTVRRERDPIGER